MTTPEIQALAATVEKFHSNFWRFSGPGAKQLRRSIIETVTGKKPLAKDCGINAMMACLYDAFPVKDWTCEAHKEKLLAEAIRKAANS